MRLAYIAHYGVRRTVLGAQVAADAQLRVDTVGKKSLALFRPALAVADMLQIFVIEIVQCGEHRVRRCLPQAAECSVLYHLAEGGQRLQIIFRTAAFGYFIENLEKSLVPDAAWGAFPAGFFDCKIQIESRYRNHTVILVHHDHSAGTHHGAFGQETVEVYRNIQMLLRQTSAGRTSGLHGLEFLSAFLAIL